MSRLGVTFHEFAEQELNDAAAYYESKVEGLGVAFIDEVERAVAQIREHPESAPRVTQTIRRKLILCFPYSIMYALQDRTIRILAIANQKRRPLYWYGRQ